MEQDEHHDDLTVLFEAQDTALNSDAFVEQVMTPIQKRARWRGPFLFGAGGLGVGAALSQIGGLFEMLQTRAGTLSVSLPSVDAPTWQPGLADPLWIGAVIIVIVSCVAIIATERA